MIFSSISKLFTPFHHYNMPSYKPLLVLLCATKVTQLKEGCVGRDIVW